MKGEALDFYSFCLGPFPYKVDKFELKISRLNGDKVEKLEEFTESSKAL